MCVPNGRSFGLECIAVRTSKVSLGLTNRVGLVISRSGHGDAEVDR